MLLAILDLIWPKRRTRFDELDINQDGDINSQDLDTAKKDLKDTAKKINKLSKRLK